MSACKACGSTDGHPMTVRPPHGKSKGQHVCTAECDRPGWFCRACRLLSPAK